MPYTRIRVGAGGSGEIGDVVRDEYPLLGRREGEHLVVVETFQRRILIERTDVVPAHLESTSHVRSRDVGV